MTQCHRYVIIRRRLQSNVSRSTGINILWNYRCDKTMQICNKKQCLQDCVWKKCSEESQCTSNWSMKTALAPTGDSVVAEIKS